MNSETDSRMSIELVASENGLISSSSVDPIVPNTDFNNHNEHKQTAKLKWKMYLSVFAMTFAMFIAFAGTTAIDSVQSSLNSEKGLGTASLAVKTASMVIQSLFLNSYCIKWFGLKGSMMVGIGLEYIYIAANFYPTWATMMISALVSGLGKPMEKTAEATYLSKLARLYVDRVLGKPGTPADEIKSRFFNFYYIFYMAARVVGNVGSSLILGAGLSDFDLTRVHNVNDSSVEDNANLFCGAHYCDQVVNSSALLKHSSGGKSKEATDKIKVYELCGFSMGCITLAISLIALFVVKLEKFEEETKLLVPADAKLSVNNAIASDENEVDFENRVVTNPWSLLLNTIRMWRKLNMVLLLPLTFYNGMDNTFFFADFTKSFVTCPFGIQWVGFAAAWYGITSPLAVLLSSGLTKPKLRPIPFFVALCCHLGAGITMLHLTQITLVNTFILSAVWGIASGLWPYTLSAFYGIVFENDPEGAFSNYWLLDSLGGTVNYSYSYYLCTQTKILILMILVALSIFGYIVVEIRIHRSKLAKNDDTKISANANSKL